MKENKEAPVAVNDFLVLGGLLYPHGRDPKKIAVVSVEECMKYDMEQQPVLTAPAVVNSVHKKSSPK